MILPSGLVTLSLLALAWTLGAQDARATPLGFQCITGNLAGDCAFGEAQLAVTVSDEGAGQVRFTFTNAGPAASAISEVYFDDGTLLGIASIVNGSGVIFAQDANPPNLPGGNLVTPPFVVTAGFLAEASSPPPKNGVGPGETLAIIFDLQPGGSFADVLADLSNGSLRIGVHVIGFASGGSESFVNVPEPGSALLLTLGLVALARRRR